MSGGNSWLEAQYSVLGSVLIEPELVPKMLLQTREDDFQGPARTVYKAIRKLFEGGSPVDIVSLYNDLGGGYKDFLAQLMAVTPTAANLENYMSLCREQARLVQVRELSAQMSTAESLDAMRELLERAVSVMSDRPKLQVKDMRASLESFFSRKEENIRYLPWPLAALNEQLFVQPGDFIIQGGYPSAGKTAFALQCAWLWSREKKVGFFSLETSPEKLFDRLIATAVGIPMGDIKRNRLKDADWARLCGMNDEVIRRKLDLIPAAGMTPADIRGVTVTKGYEIIIIDYLQLLTAEGGSRTEQVTNISMALHSMAQTLGVTVIGLSQLKRSSEGGGPRNADLRESGQLEQDADVVMLLFLEKEKNPMGNRILRISKNKEGTTGELVLAFDGNSQTFSKGNRTGEVIQQMKSAANRARRANREARGGYEPLPSSTPIPWEEEYAEKLF